MLVGLGLTSLMRTDPASGEAPVVTRACRGVPMLRLGVELRAQQLDAISCTVPASSVAPRSGSGPTSRTGPAPILVPCSTECKRARQVVTPPDQPPHP